jgi:N-acetylmuramoyl-L-alanine amidase
MQDFIAHDTRLGYEFINRGVKTANYHVLMINTMFCPSMLIELGFMSNPDELAKLVSQSFQMLLSQSVFDGILKCLTAGGLL